MGNKRFPIPQLDNGDNKARHKIRINTIKEHKRKYNWKSKYNWKYHWHSTRSLSYLLHSNYLVCISISFLTRCSLDNQNIHSKSSCAI